MEKQSHSLECKLVFQGGCVDLIEVIVFRKVVEGFSRDSSFVVIVDLLPSH